MVSTNNFFNALVGLAEYSESEGTDRDDGFIEIRRKHKGRRTSHPSGPSESQGSQQQRPSTIARLSKASEGPDAIPLSEPCLAEATSKLSLREEASKAVPGERGKAGAALSYAAITTDSSASLQLPQQLLPEKLTEAGSSQPEPAAQTSAEEASPPNAGEGEDAAAAVVADPSASEIKVISSQSSLRKGRNKQNKSGLEQPLVWLDLEMTGLDLEIDTIIEAACLMSDGSLETIIEGPEIAIQQSEEVLSSMNPWCIDHHGASGLTQRCRDSTTSIEEAEEQLLAFVARHTEPGEARLAGNSVHVDMQFLRRRMPRLFRHLHHRIVDVSTVAELCARWFPADYRNAPRKKVAHTALADVRESIEELRFYKGAIFKQPPSRRRR